MDPLTDTFSVDELTALLRDSLPGWGVEHRSLARAAGRVLREDLLADRPWPPFDRVAMDGVALRHGAWLAGRRDFAVTGVQAAGAPRMRLADGEACLEAMTGAPLPEGCDAVVPVEEFRREGDRVHVRAELVEAGQHVHRAGSDRLAGEILLPAGTRLLAPALAVAATVGAAEPLVARRPAVAVVSTGDELVPVTQAPLPHQIRRSNAPALVAALEAGGWTVAADLHAPDDPAALEAVLRKALGEAEVLVLSGGVSMGRFDRVPDVLQAIGFDLLCRRVAQRPGKPFVYGVQRRGTARVFGLPGNPVSSLVCLHRHVLPALAAAEGRPLPALHAELLAPVEFPKPLTLFLPVGLESAADGRLLARPAPVAGSGDYSPLAFADGFVELPAARARAEAGEALLAWTWSGR